MTDIFISYAREDRKHARAIAKQLQSRGWTVWWDRRMLAGAKQDRVIQAALDAASCVMVLWSKESVNSDWVLDEAEQGKTRGVLVPARLDDVRLPLGFGRIQTEQLGDGKGGLLAQGIDRLADAVAQVLARVQSADTPATRLQSRTYSRIPDGSKLELKVATGDKDLEVSGKWTYDSSSRKWSHDRLVNRTLRSILRSPRTYKAFVTVTFTGSRPSSATVSARVVKPDGSVHSTPWTSETMTGSKGAVDSATLVLQTRKP